MPQSPINQQAKHVNGERNLLLIRNQRALSQHAQDKLVNIGAMESPQKSRYQNDEKFIDESGGVKAKRRSIEQQQDIIREQVKNQKMRQIFRESHLYNAKQASDRDAQSRFSGQARKSLIQQFNNESLSNQIPQTNQNQQGIYYVPCRWSINGWKYVKRDPSQHDYFKNPNRQNFTGFLSPKVKLSPLNKDKINQSFDLRKNQQSLISSDNNNPNMNQTFTQNQVIPFNKSIENLQLEILNQTLKEQQRGQSFNQSIEKVKPNQQITAGSNYNSSMSTTYSRFYVPNKLNELNDWERQKNIESLRQKQLRNVILQPDALKNLRDQTHKNGMLQSSAQQTQKYQDLTDEQSKSWAGEVHTRKSFHKSKDFIADWTNVLFRN
eukprot:403344509